MLRHTLILIVFKVDDECYGCGSIGHRKADCPHRDKVHGRSLMRFVRFASCTSV